MRTPFVWVVLAAVLMAAPPVDAGIKKSTSTTAGKRKSPRRGKVRLKETGRRANPAFRVRNSRLRVTTLLRGLRGPKTVSVRTSDAPPLRGVVRRSGAVEIKNAVRVTDGKYAWYAPLTFELDGRLDASSPEAVVELRRGMPSSATITVDPVAHAKQDHLDAVTRVVVEVRWGDGNSVSAVAKLPPKTSFFSGTVNTPLN